MKKKTSAKAYCIVYGCLNTNKDPNLTFFSLPKDKERRLVWLKLIDREDLLSKEVLKKTSYLVCSAHFEESSIKIIRHLKEDAIPEINLPNKSRESPPYLRTEPNPAYTNEDDISLTQTGSLESKQIQSSEPSNTIQRKRRLLTKLKENLKNPKLQKEIIQVEIEIVENNHIKQEAPEIIGTEE